MFPRLLLDEWYTCTMMLNATLSRLPVSCGEPVSFPTKDISNSGQSNWRVLVGIVGKLGHRNMLLQKVLIIFLIQGHKIHAS